MNSTLIEWRAQMKTSFADSFEWEKIDLTWWRLYLHQNYNVIWVIVGMYLTALHLLKTWMKDRKPFDLKTPLFYWNAILAILSIYYVSRILPVILQIYKKDGFLSLNCNRGELSHSVAFSTLVFTALKIAELGDTIFLILRKKPLIFLHWFHHATALLGGFFLFIRFEPYFIYGTVANGIVHSIMYSYFASIASGIRVPKMISVCITTTQLIQFIYMISITIFIFLYQQFGGECQSSHETQLVVISYLGTYFILFLIFFKDSYLTNGKNSKKSL